MFCAKPKDGNIAWSIVPSLLEPKYVPLFDILLLSNETKKLLLKDDKDNRQRKVEINENILTEEHHQNTIKHSKEMKNNQSLTTNNYMKCSEIK